jgi:NTE family protein
MRSRTSWIAGCILSLALQGCTHYLVNAEKTGSPQGREYRFNPEAGANNSNSLFICLTFSGGGTRAAALSYGVLEKLKNTRITWKGTEKRLLDEVDCISSISGGSFTAAYYGLFGERMFQDYRTRFLEADIQGSLLWSLFKPWNWIRLVSPYFSRIDLAAEYYDDNIFEGKSFAAFAEANRRPFVIVNAANDFPSKMLSS